MNTWFGILAAYLHGGQPGANLCLPNCAQAVSFSYLNIQISVNYIKYSNLAVAGLSAYRGGGPSLSEIKSLTRCRIKFLGRIKVFRPGSRGHFFPQLKTPTPSRKVQGSANSMKCAIHTPAGRTKFRKSYDQSHIMQLLLGGC